MKLGEVIAPLILIIQTCKQYVVLVKQPQAIYLAISETRIRATKLGEVIATSNSDHTNMFGKK